MIACLWLQTAFSVQNHAICQYAACLDWRKKQKWTQMDIWLLVIFIPCALVFFVNIFANSWLLYNLLYSIKMGFWLFLSHFPEFMNKCATSFVAMSTNTIQKNRYKINFGDKLKVTQMLSCGPKISQSEVAKKRGCSQSKGVSGQQEHGINLSAVGGKHQPQPH